ncbi:hypothetical protein J5279_22475 [Rhizobium sp. B209b/85]|nr:hypothetical protein [Rhizobium sp. L58/93]MBO9135903.1 hypothetical protein [Rhizobium sp. B209b/85]MBO9171215.1 hypothetical protein [Rhizobium sp. L245/93]MBO9187084.1 hypothetical protein [Rhizobium sp. E27B/91]
MAAIPAFENETEERAFWEDNDSALYLDWSKTQTVVLPNLKKSAMSSEPDNGPRTDS